MKESSETHTPLVFDKFLTVSASVLKILVGLLFIVSAVSKLVSMEAFEMYVYSFGILPLALCGYLSRVLLACELILGVALVSHRHHRFTLLMTLLFLIAFVVFLAYAHLSGRTDSCHCFGELLPFDPIQSLMKNAVLIALSLYVYKFAPRDWAPRWWLVLLVYLLLIAAAFCYMYWKLHYLYLLGLLAMGLMMVVGLFASFDFYRRWYVTLLLMAAPLVTVFFAAAGQLALRRRTGVLQRRVVCRSTAGNRMGCGGRGGRRNRLALR